MQAPHSYDATCLLQSESLAFARQKKCTFQSAPVIRSQFFYSSNVSIDDPLAPVTPPSAPNARPSRPPLRPFSVHDNTALETSWLKIFNRECQTHGTCSSHGCKRSSNQEIQNSHGTLEGGDGQATGFELSASTVLDSPYQSRKSTRSPSFTHESTLKQDSKNATDKHDVLDLDQSGLLSSYSESAIYVDTNQETSIPTQPRERVLPMPVLQPYGVTHDSHMQCDTDTDQCPRTRLERICVGTSRLNYVEVSALQMSPIYWDPLNDTCPVIRGTWFNRKTMQPLPTELANRLEVGYREIQPWTQSYQEELGVCLELGPEAETKLAYGLWTPKEQKEALLSKNLRTNSTTVGLTLTDSAQLNHLGVLDIAAGTLNDDTDVLRPIRSSSVIFINAFEGQILQPHQLPSLSRKRGPLAAMLKGMPVGLPVIRSYNTRLWEKANPPTPMATERIARATLDAMRRSASARESTRSRSCPACLSAESAPVVSDLVLMVHGIGQKLSERMENYHFTHLINSFRQNVLSEQQSNAVHPFLRPDFGGIMVLPVNWRSKTDFDEMKPMSKGDSDVTGSIVNRYTLKDITAQTLPAVRSVITDVMLDIPFYLSHHKPKIIQAVIAEANRIYRLWCKNNPLFHESGRVHILAHSLGSIMAIDILSNQPDAVAHSPNPFSDVPLNMFEFNTTNLFLCGSPAGFFLLLNHASLVPRRNRRKPDEAHRETVTSAVGGEQGTYGCLSVDNVYNLVHENDPVTYQMNACVDAAYASQLQTAYIPSINASWGEYLGAMLTGSSCDYGRRLHDRAGSQPDLPARMPATVELETHDFNRQEIVEQRMYLLNDNGQIDYKLRSSGGPLEIQYLTMLSAHSSYWYMKELFRFLVLEIGRRPGRQNTISKFVAVKKKGNLRA